jgi:DNA-binding transcriptional regulator YiaG
MSQDAEALTGSKYAFNSQEEAITSLPLWIQDTKSAVMKTFRWTPDWVVVGELVRHRREEVKMSLRSMATMMGVSATYVSDMERGLRAWPSGRLVDATYILTEAENKSNQ